MPQPEAQEDRDDHTDDPSNVEATRARMQGGGVGQKELNRQRDPTQGRGPEEEQEPRQ